MKTFNHLFEKITSFDNLLLATKKAQKGKKNKCSVAAFHFQLEENILRLKSELEVQKYEAGAYRTFNVYDPKERMISAAPYRDRVVHHALCNIIEPIFDRTFIFDSYANRKGKGTHKALDRYQHYAKKHPYVLKCDIRKFFPNIDHEILKQLLRRKIKCLKTLWLIDLIIDNSNRQEAPHQWYPGDDLFTPIERKKGLPIGNLTSQFWANVYMNTLDHFVKEQMGVKAYIRYVDDFVLFGDSKQKLHQIHQDIMLFLTKLRLEVHPNKTQVYQVMDGVPFLGFTVFPFYKYVLKTKTKRYRRYLSKQLSARLNHELQAQALEDGLNAWLGHIRFGHSMRLENTIFMYLRQQGVNLHKHPSSSWRVLEQQR